MHTAHFSIGSGTRLAMQDVIALVRSLEAEPGNLSAGLKRYEAERRPTVETLVAAARASADWYEHFCEHMRLAPLEFAMSYITRSGRIDRTLEEDVAGVFAPATRPRIPRRRASGILRSAPTRCDGRYWLANSSATARNPRACFALIPCLRGARSPHGPVIKPAMPIGNDQSDSFGRPNVVRNLRLPVCRQSHHRDHPDAQESEKCAQEFDRVRQLEHDALA